MSISAITYLALCSLGIIVAILKDPFYGLITYLFTYYNFPYNQWWGNEVPTLRWSLIPALVTFVGYLLHNRKFANNRFLAFPPTKWIIIFLLLSIAITPFAVAPQKHNKSIIDILKFVLLYFLIIKLIRDKKQYKIFVWSHIIGCFRFGWLAYEDPSSGRLEGIGGPDTSESNLLAALLVTAIPFQIYYFLSGGKWEKILCVLTAPFILNAIVLCNSRGALLGIIFTGIAALFLTKKKGLWLKLVLIIIAGCILFLRLTNQTFWERQKTIFKEVETLQETGDANRTVAWKGGLAMMKNYPFGVGGGGYQELSKKHLPIHTLSSGTGKRAAHNTFILVGVEQGILGIIIFLIFMILTLKQLHNIRDKSSNWLHLESIALEVSLISFSFTGIFVDRLYTDILYWLAALSSVLRNLHDKESNLVPAVEKDNVEKDNLITKTMMGILVKWQLKKARR